MQCTVCQCPATSVVETRHYDEKSIRRRRECLNCGMRFTTTEILKEVRKKKVESK